MKGPVPSIRNANDVTEPEVKVKRKCGRPRNPIPRHKRVSHITAEHRRRCKIQNGLDTLKNMLPKYESTGRDSKADVLLKAVDNTKELIAGSSERAAQLEQLRAERDTLKNDITSLRQTLPDGKLFAEETSLTPEQRLENMMSQEIKKNWKYYIFSFFARSLHQTYQDLTDCSTKDTFNATVRSWANTHLSQKGFRSVATEALSTLSKSTSFLDNPAMMPQEALQHCNQDQDKIVPTTITSADEANPIPDPHPSRPKPRQTAAGHRRSGVHKAKHPSSRKRPKKTSARKSPSSTDSGTSHAEPWAPSSTEPSRTLPQGSPGLLNTTQFQTFSAAAARVKTESVPSFSMPYSGMSLFETRAETTCLPKTEPWASNPMLPVDLPSKSLDSPSSGVESATALSSPRSSQDSSVFGELTWGESSLDTDTDAKTPASAYTIDNFLQSGSTEGMLADLEDIDFDDFIHTINQSADSSTSSSVPYAVHSQPLPQPQPQPQPQLQPPSLQQSSEGYSDTTHASNYPFLETNMLENMDLTLLDDVVLMDIEETPMTLGGNEESFPMFNNDIISFMNDEVASSHDDENLDEPKLLTL